MDDHCLYSHGFDLGRLCLSCSIDNSHVGSTGSSGIGWIFGILLLVITGSGTQCTLARSVWCTVSSFGTRLLVDCYEYHVLWDIY